MGLWSWLTGKKADDARPEENELRRIVMAARQARPTKPEISTELKPFVTRLRQAHAKAGSFATQETPEIGREIHVRFGHQGMLIVHDVIRSQLGPAAARDLEYKWSGIGDWLG